MTNRIRTLVIALLFLGVATACGSSSSGSGSSPGTGSGSGTVQSGTAHVTIQNFAFHPATLTVKTGTKVTFTNEDSTIHTATSSPGSSFDSGNLNKGQSFTFTFTKAGTYSYICSIHQNMKGTVTVQ
jgi:plastocyanin